MELILFTSLAFMAGIGVGMAALVWLVWPD
jgi:hypothetical protein